MSAKTGIEEFSETSLEIFGVLRLQHIETVKAQGKWGEYNKYRYTLSPVGTDVKITCVVGKEAHDRIRAIRTLNPKADLRVTVDASRQGRAKAIWSGVNTIDS